LSGAVDGGRRVPPRRVCDIGVAGLEGSVEVVVSRHDELAAHLIELVPAHVCSIVRRVRVGARTNAELGVVNEKHPLGNGLVHAIHDVGRYIATDWVARAGRTVRVELTTFVAADDIEFREIAVSENLDVKVGFEEGYTGDGAIRNDASIVTGLSTPRNLLRLSVGNVVELWRGEDTEVVY